MMPISGRIRWSVRILFVLLVLLTAGWAIEVLRNWDEVSARPVRLAYLICDVTLVILAGFIATFGMKAGKGWAFALFPFVLGALLYATAHNVFYVLWDNYFGIPWIVAFLLLAAVGAYVLFALKAVRSESFGG